jgi:signal transduction histidine kinase
VKRLEFRARLFLILLGFAVLPSVFLTLLWAGSISEGLSLVGASAAWDSVAATGERAISAARADSLTPAQQRALRDHEEELRSSLLQARRVRFLAERAVPVVIVLALLGVAALTVVASRVAGHLSRQLSRPLAQLVDWTGRIARQEPLPDGAALRGAPEFGVLRERMRSMAEELALGRTRALEAERAEAFRETARRVAHELKNPLTPIRFAVERLRREAPPELAETVEVLAVESQRLEQMARSFGTFGRLPEGPAADVDVGELVRYAARATVPETVPLRLEVPDGLPMVRGHHDALARALSNVLINAVEACSDGGEIAVRVARRRNGTGDGVEVIVEDTGCGIPPERLARIWEPYITYKPGGTGLGLAIARQTIAAHRGEVNAESTVGEGTTIRFVLPAQTTPPTREEA